MNPAPLSIDLNEDHHHMHLLMISPKPQSSSSSCPTSFNPDHQYPGLSQADKYDPTRENIESDSGLKLIFKVENQTENSTSSKWIPSKLRILRKMMNSDQAATSLSSNHKQKFEDQKQPSSSLEIDTSTNNKNTIRVCTDCNTTKTPLWRSGPRGPKSLCNACGIRQRKARRAAAAAAAANGTGHAAETPSVKSKVEQKHKVKRSSNGHVAQYKKPCKLATDPSATKLATDPSAGSRKNLCFEDFTVSLRKKYAAFQQVFPQDEKEAAILLMALSYGLVRG